MPIIEWCPYLENTVHENATSIWENCGRVTANTMSGCMKQIVPLESPE